MFSSTQSFWAVPKSKREDHRNDSILLVFSPISKDGDAFEGHLHPCQEFVENTVLGKSVNTCPAWHCDGREGLWEGSWSPRRLSLMILWCNFVAPECLGPLLWLLIHLNFLTLARKNHSYIVNKVTASTLPLPTFLGPFSPTPKMISAPFSPSYYFQGLDTPSLISFSSLSSPKLINQSQLLQQPVRSL